MHVASFSFVFPSHEVLFCLLVESSGKEDKEVVSGMDAVMMMVVAVVGWTLECCLSPCPCLNRKMGKGCSSWWAEEEVERRRCGDYLCEAGSIFVRSSSGVNVGAKE